MPSDAVIVKSTPSSGERLLEELVHALGDRLDDEQRGLGAGQDRRTAGQVAQQQQELVAALSRDHVGLPGERHEARGELDEQVVAGDVPQAVVHELEVVQVHEDDADGQVEPAGAGDGVLELLLEAGTVRQARELVVVRQVRDLSLGLLALRDVLDHRDRVLRLAVGAALKRRGDVTPHQLPVLAEEALLDLVRVVRSVHHLLEQLLVALDVLRMGVVAQRHRAKLGHRVAEHQLERGVRIQEAALRRHQRDADGGALVDRLEPRERLDLLALRLELRGVAERRREHHRQELQRLEILLREEVGLARDDDQLADRLLAVTELHRDGRAHPELVGQRARIADPPARRPGSPTGRVRWTHPGNVPSTVIRAPICSSMNPVAARTTSSSPSSIRMVALSACVSSLRALADRVHHRVDVQVGHRDFPLRLDDRGHAPAPCGLRLLGLLAGRDVEQHALDQPGIAVLVVDRTRELQDPSDRPVLVDHAVLVAQREMAGVRVHVLVPRADEVIRVHVLRPAVLVREPCLGLDPEEIEDLRAHRDAVRRFVHRVQVDDAGHLIDERRVLRLALEQRLFQRGENGVRGRFARNVQCVRCHPPPSLRSSHRRRPLGLMHRKATHTNLSRRDRQVQPSDGGCSTRPPLRRTSAGISPGGTG